MTEREDEMTRAINERARKLVNAEESTGKTYADFKAAQEKKQQVHAQQSQPTMHIHENPRVAQTQGFQDPVLQGSQEPQAPKTVKTFAAYGGFWRRLAASFLDMWPTYLASVLVYGYVLNQIINEPGYSNMFMDLEGQGAEALLAEGMIPLIAFLAVMVANVGYNIYLYYARGTTLGYRALGLRIIDKKLGKKPSTPILLARFTVKFVALAIPFLNYVYVLIVAGMIIFTKNKQAPHDAIAGTLVVSDKIKRTWLVWVVNILTVGVGILGVVAGILFVALDPARMVGSAEDVMVQVQLAEIPMQSTLYYSQNQYSYKGVCDSLNLESGFDCLDSESAWAVTHQSGLCTDATGYRGEVQYGHAVAENNSCTTETLMAPQENGEVEMTPEDKEIFDAMEPGEEVHDGEIFEG